MKRALLALLLLGLSLTGCSDKDQLVLGGGPYGGTFQMYADGLELLLNNHLMEKTIKVERSGGSLANLDRLEKGRIDLGLVFAGDAYVGYGQTASSSIPSVTHSRTVARLYDSVAQLIVRQSSPVLYARQLEGTRVAVGSPGSGSALSAQRFFQKIGIWHRIVPIYISLAAGMDELGRGRVEAVWAMVGFPDQVVEQKSRDVPIRLLNLFDEAVTSGLFQAYPFYAATKLLAQSYGGMEEDVASFMDGALLLARPEVPNDYIYRALKLLYSRNGQAFLSRRLPVGLELDPDKGRMGVRLPLHPGAVRFWQEFEAQRDG